MTSQEDTFPPGLAAPPNGFNPLQATLAQLSAYGFPAKPSNPAALATWTTAMEDAKTYVVPEQSISSGPNHVVYNNHWAGYVVPSSGVYDVSATWVQPSYNEGLDLNPADASFWVGMGGYYADSNGLVQAGADSGANNAGGSTQYEFWVEDAPLNTHWEAKPVIQPGDTLYVDVTYDGSTSQAFLENETANTYTTVTFNSPDYDGSTVDVINEAVGATYTDWTSWGHVTFTGAIFTAGSEGGDLTAFPTTKIIMTNNGTSSGTEESVPGALNSSTSGFTVTAK